MRTKKTKKIFLKKVSCAILIISVLLTMVACNHATSNGSSREEQQDIKSDLAWVGHFDIVAVELEDSVYAVDDLYLIGVSKDWYIEINRDFTGIMSVNGLLTIECSYDAGYQSGYIYANGISEAIPYKIEKNRLIATITGATWIFEKR